MAISPLTSTSYTGSLKIDPSSFDASVCSLLICLDGEKYIDIFRSRNISQATLMELTDDDLRKLGIDDPKVRAGLVKEVKNFPMYDQLQPRSTDISDLDLTEISYLLRDSNQQMHRIYLGMLSMNMTLRRSHFPELVVENRPVTTILMNTLDEIAKVLDKMEYSLQTKFQFLDKDYETKKRKKIMIGTVGGAAIAILGVLFIRSLKNLR